MGSTSYYPPEIPEDNPKTNEIHTPLTGDDAVHGQIGIDGFGQIVHWRPDGAGRIMSIVADVRGKTCRLCGRHWEHTTKGWVDQYAGRAFHELVHYSCMLRFTEANQFLDWGIALAKARLRFDKLKPIDNEYRGAWNTPWYTVQPISDVRAWFKLGRRKRVDHIEVFLSLDAEKPARATVAEIQDLFADENVTKIVTSQNSFCIHAWTKEKREEYLAKIVNVLLPGKDECYDDCILYDTCKERGKVCPQPELKRDAV